MSQAKLGTAESKVCYSWSWKWTKWVPGAPIQHFLALGSEIEKMGSRIPILAFSGIGPGSVQNGFQEFRLDDFLALGPEVDKMGSRSSDLSISLAWVQKSTKWVPRTPI